MNTEQLKVLKKVARCKNVFVTGGAGVGKSFLLKQIVQWARDHDKLVGVTAMTGAAAVLVDGTTLHSFMGIGLAKDPPETLARRVNKNVGVRTMLVAMDMLIIDEVSMMNDDIFDKVSAVLSLVRKVKQPFGGVQVVLVGDPFQLSPVEGDYFFLSKQWRDAKFDVCLLTANMRQCNDAPFKEMLDRLRLGECSAEDLGALRELRTTVFPDGIIPTRLYSVNKDVDTINETELKTMIDGGAQGVATYKMKYGGNTQVKTFSRKWAEALKLRQSIQLCIGAQVMVTRNISVSETLKLANGTRGVVLSTAPSSVWIRLMDGSVEKIEYFKIKPYSRKYYSSTGEEREHAEVGLEEKEKEEECPLNVSYLPLQLAWAISIHKSQGCTLDAVDIDLGTSIFACGQAYTALSRAKDMRSVRLVDVYASSFRTNPTVLAFHSYALALAAKRQNTVKIIDDRNSSVCEKCNKSM
jgi:ATP-dependent DNA helicase PIF1